MDFDEIKRVTGESTLVMLDALDQAEVQEALKAWSEASFGLIRALERAGLTPPYIAGVLGGGAINVIQQMREND